MRIETAENLIGTSNLSISQIVHSISFSNRNYFSKILKQKYNCTPKQYKKYKNLIAETA